jgi:hypothetical protein
MVTLTFAKIVALIVIIIGGLFKLAMGIICLEKNLNKLNQ